ncbi:MAG: DUF302 domain-containing protein [Dehalococcoidia bacterium]|nr:DUF302 domain-containing protein [Dehalococcoidia bacterium]
MRRQVSAPYAQAVDQVRAALKDQGFGVLTEIDVKATLKAKLDADMAPYIILGACNPPLAHRAISTEPEVGMLLPCNVVVREENGTVYVEAMDPEAAMGIVQNPAVHEVAMEAKERLSKALAALP